MSPKSVFVEKVSLAELVFDGEETAITSIIADESLRPTDESWYTLDGRCLSSEPTAPGIYVNRGRKIVIK